MTTRSRLVITVSLICSLSLGCSTTNDDLEFCKNRTSELRNLLREDRYDEFRKLASEMYRSNYNEEDVKTFYSKLPSVIRENENCSLESWTIGFQSPIGYAAALRYKCSNGESTFVDQLAFRKEDGVFKLYNYHFEGVR